MSQRLRVTCTDPATGDATFVIGTSTRLELTITNSGTEALDLQAATTGHFVEEADNDRAHPDPSAFYVYLDEVVDPAVLPSLTVTTPTGWEHDHYADGNGRVIWVITAVDASLSPLASGAMITVTFAGLSIVGATRTSAVVVDPRVIPGFFGSLRGAVSLVEPSTAPALPVDITVVRTDPAAWVGDTGLVFTTCDALPVTNQLSLTIKNTKAQESLIKAWSDTAPTFTVTFSYADAAPGDGALTTPADLAAPFEIAQGDTHGQGFVGPDTDGAAYPSWTLRPACDNHVVLEPGMQEGSVEIVIQDLPVPLCDGDASVFITSSHFPGYADTAWVRSLTKTTPTPRFNPEPQPLTPSAVTAFAPGLCPPFDLTWEAFGATSFEVSWAEGGDVHAVQIGPPAGSYRLDPQPSVDGALVTGLTVSATGIGGDPAVATFDGTVVVEQLLPLLTGGAWWTAPDSQSYSAYLFGADRGSYLVQLGDGVQRETQLWSFDPVQWLLFVDILLRIDRANRTLTSVDSPSEVWAFVGDDPVTQFLTSGLFTFTVQDPDGSATIGFSPGNVAFYYPWTAPDYRSGFPPVLSWAYVGDHNVHLVGQSTDLTLTPDIAQGTLTADNGAVFTLDRFPV